MLPIQCSLDIEAKSLEGDSTSVCVPVLGKTTFKCLLDLSIVKQLRKVGQSRQYTANNVL
jgi:hypothetical protein